MSSAEIGNLRVNLGIDTAEFAAGARQAQSTLAGLQSSLKGFAATALASLSLGAVGAAALQAVKDVAQIGDLAETIGITAEQVQNFNRMALASGASTDVMAKGLQEIAEQTTNTNSALSKLFAANGLAVQGREVNDVILDFMTLLRNAKSPADQLAIATSVLGTKVGRELVEALRTGADGYDIAMQAMVKSGEYHSNAEVARLQDLETKYNEAAARIATVWQQMVVGIVKGIDRVASTPELLQAQKPSVEDGKIWTRAGIGLVSKPKKKTTRTSGFGTMGGPNEFSAVPIPVKPTVMPAEATEAEKLRQEIEKLKAGIGGGNGVSTPGRETDVVLPVTLGDMRGPALELRNYNDELRETDMISKQIASNMADGLAFTLTDIAFNAKSAGEAMRMLKASALDALQGLTQQLLKSGLNMLLGNLGTRFGGAQGFGGFGGFYADGGTLGAGKWGIAGEAGPEIIHGPARVTPMTGGGGRVQVKNTVINNGSSQVSTRATQGADGTVNIETLVEDKVLDTLGGGRAARVMGGRFGARVQPRRT